MNKIINKPWGYEELIKHNIKLLHINKGSRLSLQYHKNKDEFLCCLSGVCEIETGGVKGALLPGGYIDIGHGILHRFSAVQGDVELLEIFEGELDDVVRVEDDYGRIENAS